MALIQQFSIDDSGDCTSFKVYDDTGTALPGGYSAGTNPSLADVASANLAITPYLSSTTYNVQLYSASIPFPNTSGIPAIVLSTSLGLAVGQTIPSQLVSMTYATFDDMGNPLGSATQWVYLDCMHLCCSDGLWAKYVTSCNKCQGGDQKLLELAERVSGAIKGIQNTINKKCMDLTAIQKDIDWLNAICEIENCSCR